jgi:hypothetical protein
MTGVRKSGRGGVQAPHGVPPMARSYASGSQFKRLSVWLRQQKPYDLVVAIQRDPYITRTDAFLNADGKCVLRLYRGAGLYTKQTIGIAVFSFRVIQAHRNFGANFLKHGENCRGVVRCRNPVSIDLM